MAIRHRKGQITVQRRKYKDGIEIRPCKMYTSRGKSKMVGSIDGEVILDSQGKAILWQQLGFK
tara:strand:- start:146 stop:334 length:189 start_codon:yes stop_codon:yes gene_type:complete